MHVSILSSLPTEFPGAGGAFWRGHASLQPSFLEERARRNKKAKRTLMCLTRERHLGKTTCLLIFSFPLLIIVTTNGIRIKKRNPPGSRDSFVSFVIFASWPASQRLAIFTPVYQVLHNVHLISIGENPAGTSVRTIGPGLDVREKQAITTPSTQSLPVIYHHEPRRPSVYFIFSSFPFLIVPGSNLLLGLSLYSAAFLFHSFVLPCC